MSRVLKASVIIGGAVSSSLTSALSSTRDSLGRVGSAIATVDRQQRLMGRSIQTFGRMGRNVEGLRQRYAELTRQGERLRSVHASLDRIERARSANMAARGRYRGQLFEAAATVAVAAAPIGAAVKFESAMADVRKVVDFDTVEQFQQIGNEVRRLSTVLPMAAADIAAIVAAGGRSGLASGELMQFAESAIKVGVAFNMTAEDAGQMMAELRSAFRMNQGQVNELVDKMNLLANTTASTEQGIASVVRRVGPLGEVAGMASGEVAALGATLIAMGVQQEVAATGIQNMMLGLVAGESATARQRRGFERLGLSTAQIAQDMQRDAAGTIMTVLEGVNALDQHARASALQDLFGRESIKAIAPLLSNTASLAENLEKVASAQNYAGAVEQEYQTRAATTANKLQILRNRFADLGVVIGNTMLPVVNALANRLGPAVTSLSNFVETNQGATRAIVGTAVALSGLRLATLGAGYAWTFIRGPILSVMGFIQRWRAGNLISGMARAGRAGLRVARIMRTVGAVLAGIGGGPVAVAVAAITAGAILVRRYWQPIAAFFRGVLVGAIESLRPAFAGLLDALQPLRPAWDGVAGAIGRAWEWVTRFIEPVEHSAESLSRAGEIGRSVGQVITVTIRAMIRTITAAVRVVTGMANAWRQVRVRAGEAIQWILDKAKPLRDAVGAVGRFFGRDGDGNPDGGQAPAPAPARMPPPLPPPTAGRGAGGATVHQANTFNITQQPGESQEALARRIADEQQRRAGVNARGALADLEPAYG